MVFEHFIFNLYKGHATGRNKNANNYLKVSVREICLEVSYLKEQSDVGWLGASSDDDDDDGDGCGEGGGSYRVRLAVLPGTYMCSV